MKFVERSYLDRCMDVVMGRDRENVALFFRVPAYSDLPKEMAEKHRKSVIEFLQEKFPEMKEILSYNGVTEYKAVLPKNEFFSRFPEFPKEREDDSAFRRETEIALKKMFCSRSAKIYSENDKLWEIGNLMSARVFPKLPYLRMNFDIIESKDMVVFDFPWLVYRFYAPIFIRTEQFLMKEFGAKVRKEPFAAKITSSAWNKALYVEGKKKSYAANLIRQGFNELGINVQFYGVEMPIEESCVERFKKFIMTEEELPRKRQQDKEIKDMIVPCSDKPCLYVQLLPETYEKVKDQVAQFVKEKKLKGGQFTQEKDCMKSYIFGGASNMAVLENRIELAEELSFKTGVPAEITVPIIEIYETKDSAGNTRVCMRIPKALDRMGNKEKANYVSKTLYALVKELQARDWESIFPGLYVATYSLLIPKGQEAEIEQVKAEAMEIISSFGLKYEFVKIKGKRAQKAEQEISKNIQDEEVQA
mgnify:FL=1